ncbi:MAG: hypothetical protein ACKVIY_01990 [Acidimicrobiales bacterium]|jgi:energy-coupling factor transporter ATP-binding protein EcfA2
MSADSGSVRTLGLDPESAQAVFQLIREMTADGHTVVMCAHHLVEAEGLADNVIMLDGDPSTIGDLSMIAGVRSTEPTLKELYFAVCRSARDLDESMPKEMAR